jgi:hypothetical protein
MMNARSRRIRVDRKEAGAAGKAGVERSGIDAQGAFPAQDPSPWVAVWCPHCSVGYRLPVRWMGWAGTRIHCPKCEGLFDVPPVQPAGVPAKPSSDVTLGGEQRDPESAVQAIPEPVVRPRKASRKATGARVPKLIQQVSAANERIVAREVIENLPWDRADLAEAQTRGTLLSQFGPMLLDAFDRYRVRAGPEASTQTFRRAVRERWGIEIPGP